MSDHFKPRVAIVTGGGSGLGAALAERLAQAGSHVIVADIDLESARATAHRIGENAEAAQVDVSDSKGITDLVQETKRKHGRLDLMLNNAGTSCCGEILEISIEEWTRVLQVNLWGVIAGSIAAYSVMAEQGFGTIVNMGSMATSLHNPMLAPYVTSKCGVVGFTRVLAIEAEAHGVQVTAVCPGNIRTAILKHGEPSRFTPAIPAEEGARLILEGVARGKRMIVFPFYAKVAWWLDRLSPALLNPLRREILRRARARSANSTSNA